MLNLYQCPIFSSKGYIVLPFTFRSAINLEMIFLSSEGEIEIRFSPQIQLSKWSSSIHWKDYPFPAPCCVNLFISQVTVCMWICFWTLFCLPICLSLINTPPLITTISSDRIDIRFKFSVFIYSTSLFGYSWLWISI